MKRTFPSTQLFIWLLLLVPNCGKAQVTNANPLAARVTGRETTNGIYGMVSIRGGEKAGQSLVVEVFAACTNANEFYGGEDPNEQELLKVYGKVFAGKLLYFAPTNDFCGPMDLRGKSGIAIPFLKPTVSFLEAYPLQFNISKAKEQNPHPGTLFPDPLVFSPHLLHRFRLEDYFEIKEAGEYQLTVVPKIYKRSDTNSDICERIDVPPVTITIKLESKQEK